MAKVLFYQIAAPDAGLNKEHPPSMLQERETPRCTNVRFRGGEVFKRRGYATVGATSVAASWPIASNPTLVYDYRLQSGTQKAMIATPSALYAYGSGVWSPIKTGLGGGADGYHSACVANDTWMYTNGVDHIQKWTGSGMASDLAGGSDYQLQDHHVARAVVNYADRLLLLGTTESGLFVPQRVRWSEFGKIEEFAEAEGGGYADLEDDPGGIIAGQLLGDWVILYKAQSIIRGAYVGGAVPLVFNTIIPNTGCPAPRTIQDLGNAHVFMGEDDIYLLNGSAIDPIGHRVRDDIFNNVARANFPICFSVLNRDEHTYMLYVPHGGDTINRAYIWDYQQDKWSQDSVSGITAAGALAIGETLTIDDLAGLIGDLTGTIDELGGFEGRYFNVLADEDGYVYADDRTAIDENGVAVDASWETSDLTFGSEYVDRNKRVQKIMLEAHGDSLDVAYSTDRGATWTTVATQTLANEYMRYELDIDTTTRIFRLRLRNKTSNERFWVRWLGFRFQLGGLW